MITNVGLIWTVDWLSPDLERPVIDTHKSIGITVLGLGILRLLWRVAHRPPELPSTYRNWERASAHLVHIALYVLIIGLPLSGWIHDSAWKGAPTHPMQYFYLFHLPRFGWVMNLDPDTKEMFHIVFGTVHTYFAYMLYGLLALHVGGALKHQFIDKEPELQRMLPWGETEH